MSCAVGCLISDADYRERMEGLDVNNLVEFHLLPEPLLSYAAMLTRLQYLHDSNSAWSSTEAMRGELNEIGQAFELNTDFLKSHAFSDDAKRLNLE